MTFEVIQYKWAQKLIVKILNKFGSNKFGKFLAKHTYDSTTFLIALRKCMNEALLKYDESNWNQLETELMEYFQGQRAIDQLSSITVPFKRYVSELMAKKYPAYKLVMDADLDSKNFSTLNRKIDKLYELLNVQKNYSIVFSFENGCNEVEVSPSYTLVTYFQKKDEPKQTNGEAMSKVAYDAIIKGQTLPAYVAELERQRLKASNVKAITKTTNKAFVPIKFSLANISYDKTFPGGSIYIYFPDDVELEYTNVKNTFNSFVINNRSNTYINKTQHYVRFNFPDLNPQMCTTSEEIFIKISTSDRNKKQINLNWSLSAHDFFRSGKLVISSTPKIENHREVPVNRQIENGREVKLEDYIEYE